jgi:cytochrome c5
MRPFLPALVLLALGACSGPAPAPEDPARIAARAAAAAPGDGRLADLYAHACKACHATPGSGAPLVEDRAAWAPRLAKGEPALLKSVIEGYRGMPAGGQCFSCNREDYLALIRFMSQAPKGAPAGSP